MGLLAGVLGSGGCNRSNFQFTGHRGAAPHAGFPGFSDIDHALLAALIASAVMAALAIGIILMYVGSVMRFILFDCIITRECHIRWGWSRRLGPGWRYFGWKLGYILLSLAGIVVVIGAPLAFAFAKGGSGHRKSTWLHWRQAESFFSWCCSFSSWPQW